MVRVMLQQVFHRVVTSRATDATPRCASLQARSEAEIRAAAVALLPHGGKAAAATQALVRELVLLNTPALFLNIVRPGASVGVILRPTTDASIRLRGTRWFLDAGASGPSRTALRAALPDHPVWIMSIEHQADVVYAGDVPSCVTHVTIVVNGAIVARAERLVHERGARVWAA